MNAGVAHYAVAKAVADGSLPRASTQVCIDCGNPASHWDHYLGYGEGHELDVEPRCVSCHQLRHAREGMPDRPHMTAGGLLKVAIATDQAMYDDVVAVQQETSRKSRSDTMCYLISRGLIAHRREQDFLRHAREQVPA